MRFVIDIEIDADSPEFPSDMQFRNILNAIVKESYAMSSNTCSGDICWPYETTDISSVHLAKWSLDALAPHQGQACWKLTIFKEEEE